MPRPSKDKLRKSILKIFDSPMSEVEMELFRKTVVKILYERLQAELEKRWVEKGWTQATLDEWANEHFRTPYPRLDPSSEKGG